MSSRIKYLLLITKIMIVLMLLVYFFDNLIIIGIGFLFINMLVFFKPYFSDIDRNSRNFLLFALLLLVSLFVNLSKYNVVISNDQFFYVKTALNGFLWIILSYYGYCIGKIIGKDERYLINLLKFCMYLFLINAVINIYVWFTTTGGVISRYSFVSPITNTVSAGVVYSLLGYFLTKSLPSRKTLLSFIYGIVFIVNIVIVGTRQVQLLFCFYLIYYYYISFVNFKKNRIKIILLVISVAPVIFVGFSALLPSLAPMYNGVLNLGAPDYYVRQITIRVAYDLFLDNPIFGVGYGMFGVYNTAIISVSGSTLSSVHNGFYSILSEWGLMGLLLTMVLFLNIYFTSRKLLTAGKSISKLNIVSIIFLRGTIIVFFISNFDLFPPPNERSYYLFGFIMWILYGSISQEVINKSKNFLDEVKA